MNKQELVNHVSAKVEGLTKSKTSEVIDAVVESILEALASNERVTLVGFGTFQTAVRQERKGRNPKTGAEILIPSKNAVKFKPGTSLQNAVNGVSENA
jgi:nucleoid DNA-binding protein